MSILQLHPPDLIDHKFRFVEVTDPSGRVQVWDCPDRAMGAGADFAYGIVGRDNDAVVILDPQMTPEGRYRQVGEMVGHWGPLMPKVMYAAMQYWGEAFLVGERQIGHFCLHTLWDQYGFRNIYRERNKNNPSHPMALNLGHPRVQDDVMMRRLREAVMEDRLELRSEFLIDQMSRCMFYSPHEKNSEERVGDDALKIKLQGGGSPDAVMALAYALAAVAEMPMLPVRPKPYAPDTLGGILGHNEFEGIEDEPDGPPTWRRKR